MLYYVGLNRDHGSDTTLNISMVDAISRSQRKHRTLDCLVIELEYGYDEVQNES